MKKILELKTTRLFVDLDSKVVVGRMTGDVQFEDYKKMLLTGAELARRDKIHSIILDRRDMLKVSTEARVWVKNYYIKKHVKPIVHKIRKVAVVESSSVIGMIYGRTILATLSLFYPNLRMRSFSSYDEASSWINYDMHSSKIAVDYVINNEEEFLKDVKDVEKAVLEESVAASPVEAKELVLADGSVVASDSPKETSETLLNKIIKYLFPE